MIGLSRGKATKITTIFRNINRSVFEDKKTKYPMINGEGESPVYGSI
jgi:hypothetical protein